MDQATATFAGWALIELFGHQREAGYVTTQYFGDKAMFQVDVPEIPTRQETLTRPEWPEDDITGGILPIGTVVEREAIPGRTRLVSPGAIYAINPATEDVVRKAITQGQRRVIKVVSLPDTKQLVATLPGDDDCDIMMESDDEDEE